MKPQLIIEQKITAFTNQYSVFGVDTDGNKAGMAAFAQQKRIAIKEQVRFYETEQKSTELFSFRAEKALDVHGRYFVDDATGARLGSFRKVFGKSLFNSTWQMLDGDNVVLTVSESNKALAVLRRFIGLIPVVGDYAELIMMLFRYHFVFTDQTGIVVGRYQKTTLFRDHYSLIMRDDAYSTLDWRLFAAMGVALDALQSR